MYISKCVICMVCDLYFKTTFYKEERKKEQALKLWKELWGILPVKETTLKKF